MSLEEGQAAIGMSKCVLASLFRSPPLSKMSSSSSHISITNQIGIHFHMQYISTLHHFLSFSFTKASRNHAKERLDVKAKNRRDCVRSKTRHERNRQLKSIIGQEKSSTQNYLYSEKKSQERRWHATDTTSEILPKNGSRDESGFGVGPAQNAKEIRVKGFFSFSSVKSFLNLRLDSPLDLSFDSSRNKLFSLLSYHSFALTL